MMDHQAYCSAVAGEIKALADLVSGADLAAPVPTCPGWTLGDLVWHVGVAHRWAERIVGTRASARVPIREVAASPEGDLVEWLRSGGEALVATLRAADPDEPVWAWGEDQHQRFWARRMLFETRVHRADVELALGLSPAIAPALAADGIEEFLANLPHARSISSRLADFESHGQTLHLHATDAEGEWTVTMPPAYSWRRGHAKGDVALRGPVADLLLVVYGRLGPEAVTVFGDRELLERWLAATAL
ncbi:maleylpyruvate isomerase family mycothiol-dependent enzyme [Thermoactinospora rubra]|uniref:maleylpyruvate isomerase family mycothiol-dependent enzyme n=1 Tax=Thermoactinospora rubra TaxID=1088767 RepID=UPI000A0F5680|nr:maleylpyruvate isomerase family mycothiol-dependent enzyme [Thermoactinospora rubra]